MAHVEIFVKLPVDHADDPKMRALARYGRDARRIRDLHTQMLCYCKKLRTDGFVPDEQIGVLVYPDSPKVGAKDVARLAEVGLVEKVTGGWLVLAFLEGGNATRQEIDAKSGNTSSKGKKANHIQWHASGKVPPKASCAFCVAEGLINPDGTAPEPAGRRSHNDTTTPDPNPDPSGTPTGIPGGSQWESTETEAETEAETEERSSGRGDPPTVQPAAPAGETGRSGRPTVISDDFRPTDSMRRWAVATFGPVVDVDFETAQFISHYRSTGTRRKSWPDAWQKWLRDSAERRTRRRPANGAVVALPTGQTLTGTDARVAGWGALVTELDLQEDHR